MAVKKYKPTSPGRRFMSVSSFDEITRGKKPEKALMVKLPKNAGRNNGGSITVRSELGEGTSFSVALPVGFAH